MTDDLDARTGQLAKDNLEALDREDDPDRLAYAVQKEREDRAALELFYLRTGQRPAFTSGMSSTPDDRAQNIFLDLRRRMSGSKPPSFEIT